MVRTLLVEDEEIIRRYLRCAIDWVGLGCTIVGDAEDGQIGLERIREFQPELVITDICMPRMDGISMLEAGKRICTFESILLTGFGEFEYARKAIGLGVVDYILKPIDDDALNRAIAAAVEKVLLGRRRAPIPEAPLLEVSNIDQQLEGCKDLYVRKSLEYIRVHYAEPISAEMLSSKLGISPGYLSRCFRNELQMNFQTVLQHYRIQKAIGLMSVGGYKIYAIGEMVGYPNYKRFCEVFKQITSQNPSNFMATLEQYCSRNEG